LSPIDPSSLPPSTEEGTPELTFRAAGPADVAEVVELVESAYRGETSRQGWTTEADLLAGQRTDAEEVSAMISAPGSVVLVARTGSRTVGCCHLRHTDATTTSFGLFAVRPNLQGAGIGRALLREAAATAAARGSELLRMTVIRQRHELIAWYGRLGFEPTGETEPFPYGDERFGRPQRPDLEFVVLTGKVTRCP
jgi:ribosomal protein S18 acetylase RimI-like enzyme